MRRSPITLRMARRRLPLFLPVRWWDKKGHTSGNDEAATATDYHPRTGGFPPPVSGTTRRDAARPRAGTHVWSSRAARGKSDRGDGPGHVDKPECYAVP